MLGLFNDCCTGYSTLSLSHGLRSEKMPHSNRDLLQPPGEITAGLSAAHVINRVSFLTHTQNLEKKPLAGPNL